LKKVDVILKFYQIDQTHVQWIGLDTSKTLFSAKYDPVSKKLIEVITNLEESIVYISPGTTVQIYELNDSTNICFSKKMIYCHSSCLSYPNWLKPYLQEKRYQEALNKLNVRNQNWSDASRLVYLMTNCRYQYIYGYIVPWLPYNVNPLLWYQYFLESRHASFIFP
jgi:hypothetical protein